QPFRRFPLRFSVLHPAILAPVVALAIHAAARGRKPVSRNRRNAACRQFTPADFRFVNQMRIVSPPWLLPRPRTGEEGRGSMPKKVMIVEDNELNMKLFRDLIEASGYETVRTRNGLEALDLARAHRPDLIL